MNNGFSLTWKKRMKIRSGSTLQTIGIGVMCFLLVVCICSLRSEKENVERQKNQIQIFHGSGERKDYSILTPTILSDHFAVSDDNRVCYCITYDDQYHPYVVAVKVKTLEEQYKSLLDYTYDEMAGSPRRIVPMKGMPVKMSGKLTSLAVKAYKEFCHNDTAGEDTFKAVCGNYYLDTTQKPRENYTVAVLCIFLMVLVGLYFPYVAAANQNALERSRATLDKFDEKELMEVDQELNYPTTVDFERNKLYFTRNYIVSTSCGMVIIPVREIVEVYGLDYCKKTKSLMKSIVVVTKDGVKHEVVTISMRFCGDILYRQIVERMKMRFPGLRYGMENGSFLFPVDCYMDQGEKSSDGEDNSMVLGVVGAFLGGILGSVLWIFMGRMNFVAGIAGIFIAFFTVRGYCRFSGSLNRKGLLLSLLISFVLIYAANYMLYEMSVYRYYFSQSYDMLNLVKSFKRLPALSTTDYWSGFIKNLVLGYLLSGCVFAGIWKLGKA